MLKTILVALLVYLAIAGARLGFMAGPIDYAFADSTEALHTVKRY